MLSRRIYVASLRIAVSTIFLGALLGVYAACFPPQNVSILTKLFLVLSSILAASTLLMVVASFTKIDPDAHRHKSFRLTTSLDDESPKTDGKE